MLEKKVTPLQQNYFMETILKHIEKTTEGTCYKSYKYCVDEQLKISMPSYEPQTYTVAKDKYGETDTSPKVRDLTKKAQLLQNKPPLFRFFLDGSRRVYKIDDIAYNKKIFPVIAGQIGIACCERVNSSQFRKAILENHIVMALPTDANPQGRDTEKFFNKRVAEINDLPILKRFNLSLSKILTYSTRKSEDDLPNELKGTAVIQDEMVDCEKKIVTQLTAKRLLNDENYLIKDGSLQYKPMKTGDFKEIAKIRNNYQYVVGVSKMFNPELSKDRNHKSNATSIAELKLYERTPAFMYECPELLGDVKFSIWYVRIRDRRYTDSPFAGVLKIEKILLTEQQKKEGLDSAEVDLISANIINERSPVCYGKDQRWANHLYPVHLTETYIKSQYLSDIHFLNLF